MPKWRSSQAVVACAGSFPIGLHHEWPGMAGNGLQCIEGMEKDAREQYYPLEAPVTDAGVCWRLPSPIIDFR